MTIDTKRGDKRTMKKIVRVSFLIFCAVFVLSFAQVSYAQWNGIIPHLTTRGEVISILGEPSYDSGFVMIYDKERAPSDTRGAAIYLVNGIVTLVRVIPARDLSEGDISGTFGKAASVSFRNPDVEEHVFNSSSGKVVVMFTRQKKRAIRIDYL
jgi:uncharacterized protein YdaL